MHHSMRYKLARTAAAGGIMVLGLGSAQAAEAQPASGPNVPCFTPALSHALATATDGEVLILAPGCTYWLTSALPDISTDLTIIGDGATLRRTGNAPGFTILSVTSDVNVSISSLSFVNGGGPDSYDGGALYNDGGNVSINGGVFRDNTTDEYGGAIWSQAGTLTVRGAAFIDNTNFYGYGGAIITDDNATITSSKFVGNRALAGYEDEAYGGAIYNDGQLQLSLSSFSGNSSEYEGGALYNDGTATLVNDGLDGNTAQWGGGIYNDDLLYVTVSSITDNTASEDGGGIYNADTVYLTGDFIHGNHPDNCAPAILGCNG